MIGVSKKTKIFLYIPLILLATIAILPFIMMIANAGRSDLEISSSVALLPSGHFGENLQAALDLVPIFRGLVNSLFVATSATILTVYFSTMVAYGFSIYEFKHKNLLFSALLLTMMIPSQFAFLGFYELVSALGLLNTYIPLILPAIASASTVFFLTQYCKQAMHVDIVNSARIDGASELKIFHRIAIPALKPGMATMAIFTFIWQWNTYLIPLLILNDVEKYTLPVMIRYISGVASLNMVSTANAQGAIFAASAISVIPVLVVFIIFSRQIIGGLNEGAVK